MLALIQVLISLQYVGKKSALTMVASYPGLATFESAVCFLKNIYLLGCAMS